MVKPTFKPDVSLYGREVFDGDTGCRLGNLDSIDNPFTYVIDGRRFCVGQALDFYEHAGKLYLDEPELV